MTRTNPSKTDRLLCLVACAAIAAVGCGGGSSSGGGSGPSMSELLEQQAQADAEAAKQKAAAEAQAAADAKRAEAARLANQGATELRPEDMQRGSKMKSGGYLQTVLKGGIRGEQKLNLHTIEHAQQLFWGLEGRYPKDHDEFMEKIIEANGIVLEELQEPYEYWYNGEDHTLYKRVKPEAIEAAEAEADEAQDSVPPSQ